MKLNPARRHLSTEQSKEIMLVLRDQGHTQQETADILGVDRTTISYWETDKECEKSQNLSPPDLRVSIPRQEYDVIYERVQNEES